MRLQPQLCNGSGLEGTPIGCRVVFALSAGCYLLFRLNHHLFITFDLVCTPGDVIYQWQVQRLLLASFVHTSTLGLAAGLLLCWRRFTWLERQEGTLAFLLWFIWSSVVLHSTYCLFMVLLVPLLFWPGGLTSEVHGLFPLLTANLVLSIKDSDTSTVWLWPSPFHISIRIFPLIIIGIAWMLHWEAHLDVIVAYVVASLFPSWIVAPSPELLDKAEQSIVGQWVLSQLQASDAFVCRPPRVCSQVVANMTGKQAEPFLSTVDAFVCRKSDASHVSNGTSVKKDSAFSAKGFPKDLEVATLDIATQQAVPDVSPEFQSYPHSGKRSPLLDIGVAGVSPSEEL